MKKMVANQFTIFLDSIISLAGKYEHIQQMRPTLRNGKLRFFKYEEEPNFSRFV